MHSPGLFREAISGAHLTSFVNMQLLVLFSGGCSFASYWLCTVLYASADSDGSHQSVTKVDVCCAASSAHLLVYEPHVCRLDLF